MATSLPTPNNNNISNAWLQALEESTRCLRPPLSNDITLLESNINYLTLLNDQLRQMSNWQTIPMVYPPPVPQLVSSSTTTRGLVPSQVVVRPNNTSRYHGMNLNNTTTSSNTNPAGTNNNNNSNMTVLRILIRVGTFCAELWAQKGRCIMKDNYNKNHHLEAAQCLQLAIPLVSESLNIADEQISRIWSYDNEQQEQGIMNNDDYYREELEQDADIVHITIQSLLLCRDKCTQGIKTQMAKLRSILEPQWRTRDEVKGRMGHYRWVNNPNPKFDYSILRKESEQELRQLEKIVEDLSTLDQLHMSAMRLQQLLGRRARVEDDPFTNTTNPSSSNNNSNNTSNSSSSTNRGQRQGNSTSNRYNGMRPPPTARRIPNLPDATVYDWSFTGSTDTCEFFEKTFSYGLVKLDFYFTTGTIKTSLNHPTKGRTQLFANRDAITPELYTEILLDPRAHTNVRYQTRNNRDNQRRNNSQTNRGNNNRNRNTNRRSNRS